MYLFCAFAQLTLTGYRDNLSIGQEVFLAPAGQIFVQRSAKSLMLHSGDPDGTFRAACYAIERLILLN